jgi:hypothetical protein
VKCGSYGQGSGLENEFGSKPDYMHPHAGAATRRFLNAGPKNRIWSLKELVGSLQRKWKGDCTNSQKLDLWSVALSVASIVLILTMRLLPGLLFMALVAVLIAAAACSVLAARRGNKLWLLAAIWPVLYIVVLCMSIFAE